MYKIPGHGASASAEYVNTAVVTEGTGNWKLYDNNAEPTIHFFRNKDSISVVNRYPDIAAVGEGAKTKSKAKKKGKLTKNMSLSFIITV